MKYLSDYTKEPLAILLNKYNAFFAFSDKQFNEGKKEGVKYVSRSAGLFHEAGKTKEFDLEYSAMIKTAILRDLTEHGKNNVIERALSNYECYYTYEIDDAVEALKDYNITRKEIQEVFNKNKQNHLDD